MQDWSDLIDKHGPLVWSTIRRLIGNRDDASDCFQEVFSAALELSRKQKILSWTATLRHLASIKAIDCLRRRYRDGRIQTNDHLTQVADPQSVRPQNRIHSAELASALRSALATIEPRQAEIFSMICLDAMTYQEAAAVIGISENHVGVLLNRARSALKQRLQAYAPPTYSKSETGVQTNAKQN
jgi:RNA polymerase sigma-70 factor (ECF subfamily)